MLPRFFYRLRLKFLLATLATISLLYTLNFLGAFTHIFERPFSAADFSWPLHGNVQLLATQRRHGQPTATAPINQYNHTFLRPAAHKCRSADGSLVSARLVFLVKSALRNFGRRQAIRKSWGFERRLSDVVIRTVFLAGVPGPEEREAQAVQHMLDVEAEQYGDVVQADFHDTYFNNTVKTMLGLRWVIAHCSRAQFYMFVDDDYYVSAKNVLRFVRNPVNYPEYLEEADETLRKLARRLSEAEAEGVGSNETALAEAERVLARNERASSQQNRELLQRIRGRVERERSRGGGRSLQEVEMAENVRLFAGFVFSSAPHRHRSSKWFVTLEEYPWHLWPPYVTAGAFVLSREALVQMFYVSQFTQHFRFDDIFLGIVALKAGIEPLHCEEFYFHKAQFHGSHSYRYLIASHGYGDPEEMTRVWSESRAAGNA